MPPLSGRRCEEPKVTKQSRKKMKRPSIYIMTNKRNGTLYTGVTSNLAKQVHEHKSEVATGFTKKYGCNQLVYYEMHEDMDRAINREKQIKAGSRKKKITLIETMNPNRNDLYDDIL